MPVILSNRFLSAYDRLPLEIRKKVRKALKLLDSNPRHPSLQIHPIKGIQGIYEARIDRKYRMSFQFDGENKVMRNVDNHDECLKNP
jgi:mRNA-degrading endonuclease RelE of RelBE toxin-antitoxin system